MGLALRDRPVIALGAVVLFVVAASTVAHLASVARIASQTLTAVAAVKSNANAAATMSSFRFL